MARPPVEDLKENQFRWLEIDASDLGFLLRKHFWILILGPVLGFGIACGIAKCLKPVYATSVEIYLRPNFDQEMQLDGSLSKLDDMDSLRSVEHALVSDTVILTVVDRLGLRENPGFVGEPLSEKEMTDDRLLDKIRKRFSAKLVPATRIVELKVKDYSAQRTAVIAEAIIEEFFQHLRKDRDTKAGELRTTLVTQAATALDRALEAERTLKEFRNNNPDVIVEQDSSIVHEQLLQNGVALNDASSKLSELEGMIQALHGIDVEKDPFQVFQILNNRNSEYLSQLLTMHTVAKSEFATAQSRYTEKHPEYQAASDRLAQVESTLRTYAAEMKAGVASEHEATSRKVASLSASLSTLRSGYVGMKSTSAEFRGIKEEVDRNWNTYSSLQQKIMDLDLNPEVTPTFATVTSGPTVPDKKAWPRLIYFGTGGLVLGILAAIGGAFWCHRKGLPFTSVGQVSRQLGIPTVAAIQNLPDGTTENQLSLIENSPQFPNLLLALRHAEVVHATSHLGGADASLLPLALARTSARHSKHTLLVTFVRGEVLESRVQSSAAHPGVMTLDLPVWVLFDFERFRSGLIRLRSKFDLIILDTTGVLENEARFAVASASEHTILTIQGEGEIPRESYGHFVQRYSAEGACSTSAVYLSPSKPGPPQGEAPHPLRHRLTPGLVPADSFPLPVRQQSARY